MPFLIRLATALIVWSSHQIANAADVPGVVDCSSRSAALHNLTVYGTQILYTAVGTGTGTSFEFQLYNAVLDVDAQCSAHESESASESASGSQTRRGGGNVTRTTPWHTCFVESRDTRITAEFRFDLARRELAVNETWVCDDPTTVAFEARATTSFAALCDETLDESIGQHYCARVADVSLPVNVTTMPVMVETAGQDNGRDKRGRRADADPG